MSAVVFLKPGAEHEPPRYVVIAARCRGAWLLCRKRGQDTWELPGGHIEAGETPFDAARRELYEETGSVGSELIPVSDYRIDDCGVLFFTELSAISVPPSCFEVEEVRLFPFLPDRLSYPLFHPPMFTFVQYWLNLRSGAGEPWDLYTADRKKPGLCAGAASRFRRGCTILWSTSGSAEATGPIFSPAAHRKRVIRTFGKPPADPPSPGTTVCMPPYARWKRKPASG